jgi:hypothetical protein
MSDDIQRELERRASERRRERRQLLERRLTDEIRSGAPRNAALWILVVGGSFVLNILVLLAVARG